MKPDNVHESAPERSDYPWKSKPAPPPKTEYSETESSSAAAATIVISAASEVSMTRAVRRALGFGDAYVPPLDDAELRAAFRGICDDVLAELPEFDHVVVDGIVSDDGAGIIAEIENHLSRLYDCSFGVGESLKSIVVALKFQLSNLQWTAEHIALLRDVFEFLRVRSIVNGETVEEVIEIINEHGLDVFRGSVSEPEVITRYRIERVCE